MILFFILLFLTHILEAVAGFGSPAIAIPILSLLLGTETSVALFSTAGLVLCLLIAINSRKEIQFKELLFMLAAIVPIMPVGYLLFARLRPYEWALRLVMGLIVCFVAGREIWRKMIKREEGDPPKWFVYTTFAVGAVVQGMLSMGGALVNVYALTRIKDKSKFRATMVMVWLITNTISLLYRAFVLDVYTSAIWLNVLYAIPLVLVAFFIGNHLHRKIPNAQFASLVYIVQLVSGLFAIAGSFMPKA